MPCLSLLHSTLFSFQGSLFQLLLQPDLKICLTPGLQIQQQICCLVGPSGLEPPTLRLSVVRSSQLSYGPVRRHKLHITRRTVYSTSRSFRCISSSSQTRFAGLCSDFGRFGYYSNGGDSRDRTGDLLLARQALSQLSYIPRLSSSRKLHRLRLLN